MDEYTTIPRAEFIKDWDEKYGKSMYYPPLDGSLLTMLSDEDSWVSGAGAKVYKMDSRLELAVYNISGAHSLINKLDALAAPVADVETMMRMVGSLRPEDVNTAFEVALTLLANEETKFFLEEHLDMELDPLQKALTKHMSRSENG